MIFNIKFLFLIKKTYEGILKKKKKNGRRFLGFIWYMCLKTKNCYLKIFVKIHVSKKIYRNT